MDQNSPVVYQPSRPLKVERVDAQQRTSRRDNEFIMATVTFEGNLRYTAFGPGKTFDRICRMEEGDLVPLTFTGMAPFVPQGDEQAEGTPSGGVRASSTTAPFTNLEGVTINWDLIEAAPRTKFDDLAADRTPITPRDMRRSTGTTLRSAGERTATGGAEEEAPLQGDDLPQ